MVGAILASHGRSVEGILQSGSMTFNEQESTKTTILRPGGGPDGLRAKLEEAVTSFDDQDEALPLVDLRGGTPFNQSDVLFEEHKDRRVIVSGLNLPMLVEAHVSRFSMGSAHEATVRIIETTRDGVKVKPEELEPTEASKTAAEDAQPKGALSEGAVVGDKRIKYVLVCVDSCLLHGQVVTVWTKAAQPNRTIVVSNAVSKDDLRKRLIEQAAPPGVKANAIPTNKMIRVAKDLHFGSTKALLLFKNPEDVLIATEGDVDIKELDIRSMAHSVGKVVVGRVLSMGQEDTEAFEKLEQKDVKFGIRKVPNDSRDSTDDISRKAKTELAKA